MAASVEELILAANAKRDESPIISIAKALASGYGAYRQSKTSALGDISKQLEIQKQRDAMAAQAEMKKRIQAQLDAQKEQATTQALNGVGVKTPPATPAEKWEEKIIQNADGQYSRSWEMVQPKVTSEIPSSVMPYVQSGDLEGLTQAYGGNVPIEVARLATANRSQTGVQSRFDASQAASKEASVNRKTERVQDKYLNESKGFKDVAESYQRVVASSENPSPAGDLALIFNYMKTLDPGSTVREGEFATAAQSGAFGDRIQTAVQKITSGERLSDDMRADFVNRARMLYESQKALQDQRESEFRRTGAAMGANVDQAIIKIDAPGATKTNSVKIRVSNGQETLDIDPSDLADAEKDGYRRIK